MEEAIENGSGQDLVAEHGPPLGHNLIGRHQHAPALVPSRDELKEEMGTASLERQIPELVDDKKLRLAVEEQPIRKLPFRFGFGQRREQCRRAREQHRMAGFDDGPAEGDGEVRRFEFHPLPGESLELVVTRPEAAQGATRAIDQVVLVRGIGRRSNESTLRLDIRASQGGEHALALPEGAELLSSSRDGEALNLRLQDGKLSLPLVPGANAFEVRWREPVPAGFAARTPALDLGLAVGSLVVGSVTGNEG